jgi:PQQ-dependent catabolism-associated CXXCW motif protein
MCRWMRLIVLAVLWGISAWQNQMAVLAQASAAREVGAKAAAVTAPAEPEGFWKGPLNDPVPHTIKGGKVIHAQALAALLKSKNAVVVDVSNAPRRPENLPASTTWLPLPHRAIPGAIWIPGAGLGDPPPVLDKYFRERLATATGNDMGKPLVLYCHQRCWLSWNGAKRAIQYGHRNVYWFPEGIEGWRRAKFPTEVVQPEATP